MDRRWHSDATQAGGVRLAARVLPPVIAATGVAYSLVVLFPRDTGEAVVAAGLFLAGLGGANLARWLAPPIQRIEGADPAARLYDEESRLGNRLFLRETLSREVARNARSGTHCTLVIFETRLVGSDSRKPPAHLPEVAAYTGRTLKSEARGSDYVARVDRHHWAAVLADTNRDGARVFASRVMQQLSSKPCARGEDGAGIYVKAIATAVEWRPDLTSADAYIEEAVARLESAPRAPRAPSQPNRAHVA